ncbi:hypothetical protein M1523_04585 [Patescibacteria group bacterium]|nr:hypothetical protein [Patescibacteria group bacterium]MCL5091500.1 hypothetical protein [Patescibacteria group bacterium]
MLKRLLWAALIVVVLIVGVEWYVLNTRSSQYPSTSPTPRKTDWESWQPSTIRTYKNAKYGILSSALVKIRLVTASLLTAETVDEKELRFKYDKTLAYYDRYETKTTPARAVKNPTGFPIKTNEVYLVEWLGQPAKTNNLWRITRLMP